MRRWGCKNNCDTWMGAEMIDEKICPFMSRPVILDSVSDGTLTQTNWEGFEMMCVRERCMAWEEVPVGNGVTCKFKCRLIP